MSRTYFWMSGKVRLPRWVVAPPARVLGAGIRTTSPLRSDCWPSLPCSTPDQAARAQRIGGQRRSAQQPAAAQADEQVIQLAHFLEQFLGRRALPRDHVLVVIRRDQRGAGLGLDAAGDFLAVLVAVRSRSCRRSPRWRGRGSVQRHDDGGLHALHARSQRDGLGMVAGRERHHAGGAARVRRAMAL